MTRVRSARAIVGALVALALAVGSRDARAEEPECARARMAAEAALRQAPKAGNPRDAYDAAARAYFELWTHFGAARIAENQPMGCDDMDAVLSNAADAFEKAGLFSKAIATRLALLNPNNRLDSTESARRALADLARGYRSLGIFDAAAGYYERLAARSRDSLQADAWLDAVTLRLALGDLDRALDDARALKRASGSSGGQSLAGVTVMIGQRYVDLENWDRAAATIREGMRAIESSGRYDLQLQAHFLLGTALSQTAPGTVLRRRLQGDALREMARVRDLWARPQEAIARTRSGLAGLADAVAARALEDTVSAVAGALFFLAEDKRLASVDALAIPVYAGPAAAADARRYVTEKVAPWAAARTAAIDAATPAYDRIAEVAPRAPAFWTAAAKGRVAMMWADFVDAFRAAPVPADLSRALDVRSALYGALDAVSQPIEQGHAEPALRECLEAARTQGVFPPQTRDCEAWLAKHDPGEFHTLDELLPRYREGTARDDRPRPAQVGGVTGTWGQ